MICTCGKQMKQYAGIGGGKMSPTYYRTWKVEYCEDCHRFVKEDYIAEEIEDLGVTRLQKRITLSNYLVKRKGQK